MALREKFSIRSMIDISDGLARDLHHILEASDVGAEIEGGAVPVSRDARELSRKTGRDPLDHALGDGEDFELLFSLPEEEASRACQDPPMGVEVTRIGRVVEKGCTIERDGQVTPLPPWGYVHEFR
jgi:thiamine-monophosphate kinase